MLFRSAATAPSPMMKEEKSKSVLGRDDAKPAPVVAVAPVEAAAAV